MAARRTNSVQYAKPYGREVLDVFTCIRDTRIGHRRQIDHAKCERHLKSDREMRAIFADAGSNENTSRLAERLIFSL